MNSVGWNTTLLWSLSNQSTASLILEFWLLYSQTVGSWRSTADFFQYPRTQKGTEQGLPSTEVWKMNKGWIQSRAALLAKYQTRGHSWKEPFPLRSVAECTGLQGVSLQSNCLDLYPDFHMNCTHCLTSPNLFLPMCIMRDRERQLIP